MITEFEKQQFSVIGKEGSTKDGDGFIKKLWAEATAHFDEVAALAKTDEKGSFVGFWGVMSDFSRSFLPWEKNFSQGLYLAGVECTDDALPPPGWVKWIVPSALYIKIVCTDNNTFSRGLAYLEENGLTLMGAVQDYTDPATGKAYMLYPIKRL